MSHPQCYTPPVAPQITHTYMKLADTEWPTKIVLPSMCDYKY